MKTKVFLALFIMLFAFNASVQAKTYKEINQDKFNFSVLETDRSFSTQSRQRTTAEIFPSVGLGYGPGEKKYEINTFYQYNTYNLANTTYSPTITQTLDYNGKSITSENNTFHQENAVLTHYNMDLIMDYFYNTFNRSGLSESINYVNVVVDYPNFSNAVWNGHAIILGEGDGVSTGSYTASLDILAHEYIHVLLDQEIGFEYQSESGALEESLADVFAVFIDREDYLIGEDIYLGNNDKQMALRSIKDPKAFLQPDHYEDFVDLPLDAENDYGGVHLNSGIPNKAFYNTLSELGYQKTEELYYDAIVNSFTSDTNFQQAKEYLVKTAEKLFNPEEAKRVSQAWEKVGIY